MKPSIFTLFALLTCILALDSNIDLVDDPSKTRDPNEVKSDHVVPDINCLVNSRGHLFMETIPQFNAHIEPEPFFPPIDAMIIHINNQIALKTIGFDNFIDIKDINEYFDLESSDRLEFRVFFDKCAKIPQRFGLNIIELNYLYCVLVWKNGFEVYEESFMQDPEFQRGFFKVIENTVAEVFNYKTYIQSIKLSKIVNVYWQAFYSNFNEFLSLNRQFEELKEQTIIDIKKNNFFFNREEWREKNMFMNLYLNLVTVIRSLNKAYFHFNVKNDKVMAVVQNWSLDFEEIVVEDLYQSLFYLLMKSDETFVTELEKYGIRYKFLVPELQPNFDELKHDLTHFLEEKIRKASLFDPSVFGEDHDGEAGEHGEEHTPYRRKATLITTSQPLLNQDTQKYRDPIGMAAEIQAALRKEEATKPPPPKTAFDYIEEANEHARYMHQKQNDQRREAARTKTLGAHDFSLSEGRKLKETRRSHSKKQTKHMGKKVEIEDKKPSGHREFIDDSSTQQTPLQRPVMLFSRDSTSSPLVRDLLQVPAQPEVSDPQEFFTRMDILKKPIQTILVNKLTLSEFFAQYESRVKDYYGLSSNLELIKICKSHFPSKIRHFSNIFCLILQREANLLVQQKYSNSRVRAFLEKYLPFITYNFFTFFMILEEHNVKVDILALNLFYCEKFFSAIKLAIVSLNNLVMHFEEDYRMYYREMIRDVMMPLFNAFKSNLIGTLYSPEFKGQIDLKWIKEFVLDSNELSNRFLPTLRQKFDEVILSKLTNDLTIATLKDQYSTYVNSMNLLTYDKIREKFVSYSKKFGIRTSSDGPSDECAALHIRDVVREYKADAREKMGGKPMTEAAEDICVKKWKMFDDLFHNVFYDVEKKEIVIRKKVESNPSEKAAFEEYMENELIRVVNFFLPNRLKDELEHFVGDTKLNLERCGLSDTYSRSTCFRIFGNDKCVQVKNTFYYTRRCPANYRMEGHSCVIDCDKYGLEEDGEFCKKPKDKLDVRCPHGLIANGNTLCLKPARKYFPLIMNPFNNKE